MDLKKKNAVMLAFKLFLLQFLFVLKRANVFLYFVNRNFSFVRVL